jgi:hypothetical protein
METKGFHAVEVVRSSPDGPIIGLSVTDQERHFVHTDLIAHRLGEIGMMVCWGVPDVPGWEIDEEQWVLDVSTMFPGWDLLDAAEQSLAERTGSDRDVFRARKLQERLRAKELAASIAQVRSNPLEWASEEIWELGSLRGRLLLRLAQRALEKDPGGIRRAVDWAPVVRVLRRIEREGVQRGDRIARPRFNPRPGTTGRIRSQGGDFNPSGIRRSDRGWFTSRFKEGLIVSLDFNALDYRSLMGLLPPDSDLVRLYGDADDFHLRTADVVGLSSDLPRRREIAKIGTYVVLYGGSLGRLVRTICEITDISDVESFAHGLRNRLFETFSSLLRLRDTMVETVRRGDPIVLPWGWEVRLPRDAHPGRVIGTVGQTASSRVFWGALVAVDRILVKGESRIVMPVHDEIVLDVHPADLGRLDELKETMETAVPGRRFPATMRIGKTYEAASK